MAEVIWSEPALCDLDAIADYIALDKPAAAQAWVERVFRHVEQLEQQPESGSVPKELRDDRYRQVVEPPARIFYRYDCPHVYIVHVMRGERQLRKSVLKRS
jgi:plasmid stabilization system protein ParE